MSVMSEMLFKNPYRGRKVTAQKPYVPEHRRLEIDAVEYPLKDPEEFIRMNKKIEAEKKQKEKAGKAKSLIELLRSGEITDEEFQEQVSILEENTFVSSVPVAPEAIPTSGQTEDNLWTQGLKTEQPESSPGAILYPETYDEEIKASEVVAPNQPSATQEDIIDDLDDSFSFGQVKSGEFILIYKDNVVNVGTMTQIKETLSNVLMTEDVQLEEFIILKRVSAEMGIFIDD